MDKVQRLHRFWSWLPAFSAVAETQHLPSAALKLHVSPSALSRTIRLLEDDLGEANDIAADHPEVIAKIEAAMKEAHTPSATWKPGGKPADQKPQPGHGKKPF